jgi:hypothetical protein
MYVCMYVRPKFCVCMYVDIISFSQALSLSMYVCIYVYVTMNGKGIILHHVGTKFHMYVCMYVL